MQPVLVWCEGGEALMAGGSAGLQGIGADTRPSRLCWSELWWGEALGVRVRRRCLGLDRNSG